MLMEVREAAGGDIPALQSAAWSSRGNYSSGARVVYVYPCHERIACVRLLNVGNRSAAC